MRQQFDGRPLDRQPLNGMRPLCVLALCAQLPMLAGCASLPGPLLPGRSDVVAGFDTRAYPGDETMSAWREASPYAWVGYYLTAPCYTGTTWQGERAGLESMGWGTAAIFVGEQDWSSIQAADSTVAEQGARCTTQNLDPEHGRRDAAEADSVMAAEGFPPGTPVFIDVERMERVSVAMESYLHAWFAGMLELGHYTPALYAHERNATPLFEAARRAFADAGRSDAPILWVARSGGFALDRRPEDSGILSASIWQGLFDVEQTWAERTLVIDANVALTSIPGIVPGR